jgi:LPS-assembly lipoprotein
VAPKKSSLNRSIPSMWCRDQGTLVLRLAVAMASAALLAGCFQPLYGQAPLSSGPAMQAALASVDVAQIDAPAGSNQARIAVELRNAVLFDLTGGAGSIAPTHRLNMKMTTTHSAIIVDPNTGRTEAQITGIDVKYTLTELATGRVVLNATAFARTSSDVPGQQQRFANQRALRDAEERAANVIADQIRSRLSSYLVAGT